MKKIIFVLSFMLLLCACKNDPLASWNDGQLKKDIIAYAAKVSDKKSPSFIPADDRIAVFDFDGTIFPEQPAIVEMFIADRISEIAQKNKQLALREPYKTIINTGRMPDLANKKAIEDLSLMALTGIRETEYRKVAELFVHTAVYPKTNSTLSKAGYRPQKELIKFLKDNGFTVYICSGGDMDLLRFISRDFAGIDPEHVIGSMPVYSYNKNANVVERIKKLQAMNDEAQKPVNIAAFIGKIPVFAVGNVRSGGDIYMLRYSQNSGYENMQLLINHDDAQREFEYAEKNGISLEHAKKYNWRIVSMKSDWKRIFDK